MKKKENRSRAINMTPSSEAVHGQPVTAEEMVNKYGTYEIQPTCDSENSFPKISHGNPKANPKK